MFISSSLLLSSWDCFSSLSNSGSSSSSVSFESCRGSLLVSLSKIMSLRLASEDKFSFLVRFCKSSVWLIFDGGVLSDAGVDTDVEVFYKEIFKLVRTGTNGRCSAQSYQPPKVKFWKNRYSLFSNYFISYYYTLNNSTVSLFFFSTKQTVSKIGTLIK